MTTQNEIRKDIVAKVLPAMESGKPPWRSIHNRGIPTNPVTGRHYTGINPLILDTIADDKKYRSKYWATYHQWHSIQIQVSKKEVGTYVVNWQPFVKTTAKENLLKMTRFQLMKRHSVFNAEQCFGKECGKYIIAKNDSNYERARQIVEATGASISHEDVEYPKYIRKEDRIVLPPRDNFISESQYWSTKFHELSHWCEWRTGWSGSEEQGELIAEIASGYLESELSLPHDEDMTNYEIYLPKWVEVIKKDQRYLFEAAAQAARAVDYILGFDRCKDDKKTIYLQG